MDRIFTIEDAKKEMNDSVNYYGDRIKAWKTLSKRAYKKDGSNFKLLSKNFPDLFFDEHWSGCYVKVSFRNSKGCWDDDEINLTFYMTDEEKARYHDGEEITPDFVEKAIYKLLEKYTAWMNRDLTGLEMIESQIEAITPALDEIKRAIGEAENTNTHYTIQAYIKEYLRIL